MSEYFRIAHFEPIEKQKVFLKAKQLLEELLPPDTEIEHIGATAIPGCLTKGDIDICIRTDQDNFVRADALLREAFQQNEGSERTVYFSSFITEIDQTDIGIQLVVKDSPLDVFVAFRDRLLADSGLVDGYNALKKEFDGKDMAEYPKEKSKFIEGIIQS